VGRCWLGDSGGQLQIKSSAKLALPKWLPNAVRAHIHEQSPHLKPEYGWDLVRVVFEDESFKRMWSFLSSEHDDRKLQLYTEALLSFSKALEFAHVTYKTHKKLLTKANKLKNDFDKLFMECLRKGVEINEQIKEDILEELDTFSWNIDSPQIRKKDYSILLRITSEDDPLHSRLLNKYQHAALFEFSLFFRSTGKNKTALYACKYFYTCNQLIFDRPYSGYIGDIVQKLFASQYSEEGININGSRLKSKPTILPFLI
jgi:hypothetical protein